MQFREKNTILQTNKQPQERARNQRNNQNRKWTFVEKSERISDPTLEEPLLAPLLQHLFRKRLITCSQLQRLAHFLRFTLNFLFPLKNSICIPISIVSAILLLKIYLKISSNFTSLPIFLEYIVVPDPKKKNHISDFLLIKHGTNKNQETKQYLGNK